MTTKYTVWVGGSEVNDYHLNYGDALDLALAYKEEGYDDVIIEKLEEENDRV